MAGPRPLNNLARSNELGAMTVPQRTGLRGKPPHRLHELENHVVRRMPSCFSHFIFQIAYRSTDRRPTPFLHSFSQPGWLPAKHVQCVKTLRAVELLRHLLYPIGSLFDPRQCLLETGWFIDRICIGQQAFNAGVLLGHFRKWSESDGQKRRFAQVAANPRSDRTSNSHDEQRARGKEPSRDHTSGKQHRQRKEGGLERRPYTWSDAAVMDFIREHLEREHAADHQ